MVDESFSVQLVMDDNVKITGVSISRRRLYLFRVAYSDALSTAINWGPDKNKNDKNYTIMLKYYFYR